MLATVEGYRVTELCSGQRDAHDAPSGVARTQCIHRACKALQGTDFRIARRERHANRAATTKSRSVQLTEPAPQHLRLEVRRVTRGRAFRWLERFTEVAQKSLDVARFDDAEEWLKNHDESLELEFALATGALQDVNLECAFHQFSPGAIVRVVLQPLLGVAVGRRSCCVGVLAR